MGMWTLTTVTSQKLYSAWTCVYIDVTAKYTHSIVYKYTTILIIIIIKITASRDDNEGYIYILVFTMTSMYKWASDDMCHEWGDMKCLQKLIKQINI